MRNRTRPVARALGIAAVVLAVSGPAVALAQTTSPRPSSTPSPTPGAAVPANPQDQIVLSGRVTVPRGQVTGEIVVFTGRALIAGVVQGDVVVVDGPVTVSGQVSGSVVAFDGSIRLAATAQVGGDVIARETVNLADGAQVGGEVRAHAPYTFTAPARALGRFASWLAVSVSTLLLGLLLLWLTPRGADRVLRAARETPWVSALWGLAMTIAIPLVCGALVLTLVALPLGLVGLLAVALLLFVSYAWAMWIVGRSILREGGRVLPFLLGWGIARVIGLIPVVSGVTFGLGAVFGLGAMTVAIWRARGVARRRGGSHRRGYVSVPEAGEADTDEAAPEEPDAAPAGEPIS